MGHTLSRERLVNAMVHALCDCVNWTKQKPTSYLGDLIHDGRTLEVYAPKVVVWMLREHGTQLCLDRGLLEASLNTWPTYLGLYLIQAHNGRYGEWEAKAVLCTPEEALAALPCK